jgi:KDO2-lipid IV(A) lauroyltransferase
MTKKKSFSRTKDRIWVGYNKVAGWLARRSMPVRKIGYGVFGVIMWTAYILPGNMVRPTFRALAQQSDVASPTQLFSKFVKGFCRGINRIEQVRHGRTDAVDAMLRLPDQERLDQALSEGGAIIAIPHTHASLAMGRGLGRKYPILALVRTTGTDERRAASETEIYENLGCEYLDIRIEKPAIVARKVLTALNNGRLVVGTVDRIRGAPKDAEVDSVNDIVGVTAFGEPIGITGWPARFGKKAGVPIIPSTIVQTSDTISLHLGQSITPDDDLVGTTQRWTDELVRMFTAYPDEWVFALDKHWSKALRASDKA